MRQTLLCVIALFLMTGCAQTEKHEVVITDDFQNQILSQQFKKKGAYLYCDQPSYLKCLNIDRDQCLKELKPFTKECFEYASASVSGNIAGNSKKFINLFGFCMFSKHLMFRGEENLQEIGMCLQNNPFDEDQIQKSLTPTNYELIMTISKDEYDLERLCNNTDK